MKIKDLDTGDVEFHGILDIHPVKAAQRAIRKLNRQVLHQQPVEVRKWHSRSSLNERRQRPRAVPTEVSEERRQGDRRRPNVAAEVHTPLKPQGTKTFHRLYGF